MAIAVACTACRGVGTMSGVRCRTCRGVGTAASWGELVLTWAYDVDPSAVRGRTIVLASRAVVALACAVGGVALVAWGVTRAPTARLLVGGGALLTCAAITMAHRARRRSAVIAPQTPDAPDAGLSAPPPFDRIATSAHRSVATALAPDARLAIERGARIARQLHHATVTPVHVLAGILTTASGGAAFVRLGVDFSGLRTRIQHILARLPAFAQPVGFAPEAADLLFEAYAAAARERAQFVGVADLLIACSAHDADVREILDDLGIAHRDIVNVGVWVRLRGELRSRYRAYRARGALRPRGGMNRAMTAIATPILDTFAEDLTAAAARLALGPTVGRTREFSALIRGLESDQRGVLLVGPAGVGKSAIIEGLAMRMAADDVPAFLRDQRLVRLIIPRITSGVAPEVAQERLLAALDEVVRSRNIVLVIDPIEQLISAHAATASVDLAAIIAGAVERSAFRCIGVTTPEAYRRSMEPTALANAFERIEVAPPEFDDAIQMVEARAILTESRTRVICSYRAIEACVRLSTRYLHDRALPESAVVLLDEVATAVARSRGAHAIVLPEDVAALVAEKTGVPVTAVTEDEAQVLLHLEERIHERMVGQDEAVAKIAAALRRARVELREGKRPIATFLFLGPTGVGKTELAKTVAATYFHDERAMVRLDMSEYQDAASIHRLIGAPPGFAGAEAGGQFTEAIRRKPFSLVLLDEIEKAHPDILNVFLQVFDDGRLTDSAGRTVDFTNAIIIATSNAGAPYIQEAIRAEKGIEDIRRALLETELRGTFRPEFLNRFDGTIVFTPLTEAQVRTIAQRMLATVDAQLAEKGIHLRVTDAAVAELAAAGFDPQFGARPLRRVIQERVQDALATFLLEHKLGRRDTVVLDASGAMTIEKAAAL